MSKTEPSRLRKKHPGVDVGLHLLRIISFLSWFLIAGLVLMTIDTCRFVENEQEHDALRPKKRPEVTPAEAIISNQKAAEIDNDIEGFIE